MLEPVQIKMLAARVELEMPALAAAEEEVLGLPVVFLLVNLVLLVKQQHQQELEVQLALAEVNLAQLNLEDLDKQVLLVHLQQMEL